MSDLYEEYGLEVEEDASLAEYASTEKKNSKTKKKGGGWFRSVLAVGLGVIIGVGAVAGGGYFALTSPARSTIELVGGFAGIDYEEEIQNKFLSVEYEEKSLLEIAKELTSVIKDKNLVGINNISPAVGEYLDKMVANMQTEFGVEMDTDTIIKTPFHDLPAYLGETFRVTPLGNMIKSTSKTETLEPILMELCYGEEGVHYDLDENGEVVMKNGHEAATFETFGTNPNSMINKVSLAAVVPPSADDSLMLSMAYGKENITYTMQRNEDGTVAVDEKGHPIITMLPLYFEKEGEEFYDYNGDLVVCETTVEGDYIRMDKAPTYEGSVAETYYLKAGEDNKYYAYTAASEDADPVKFKKTMIGDLSEDSSALINDIYLKDALNVVYDPEHPENDPHAILFSLSYGTEGVDYTVDPVTKVITMIGDAQPRTIGDLRERGNDIINDVAISDIMHADMDDSLSMYLLYGKKGIHYDFDADGNLIMLQKFIAISDDNQKVYNEYGELLQPAIEGFLGYTLTADTFTNAKGNVYNYQAADPVKTIKTPDGQMKVYYLTQEGNPVMFTKHSLGELSGSDNLVSKLTNRLSLAEVLHDADLSNNKFLKHVSDCSVSEIPTKLLEVSVTDMFSEEIYSADAVKYEGNEPLIAVNGATIANGDYYTVDEDGYHKAELSSTWKYLLTDPNGIKQPSEYKVATDMSTLITNMTTNVQNAKMYDLKKDGIIAGLDDGMLNTLVRDNISGKNLTLPDRSDIVIGTTKMGHLTVTEMLTYTSSMMAALTELGL